MRKVRNIEKDGISKSRKTSSLYNWSCRHCSEHMRKTTGTVLSMCEKQVKLAVDDSRGLDPGKSTNQPKTCTFYIHDMTYHTSMHMYDIILPVFGVLSRMVKVRGACDKPFWIYKRLNNCAAPRRTVMMF